MRLVEHRGKWAVRTDGRRFSTGYDATSENRSAAERAAREIINARAKARAGTTCDEIMDAYIEAMPLRANPKVASDPLKYARNAVAIFFKNHSPEQVTEEECRAYITKRRHEGRSDGTIRKELSVLQAALNWNNTPGQFDYPAPPPPRDRWLTREEFKSLLEGATGHHVKTFLHIAICTGARKEAILSMRWDRHIDFERRTIWPGFKAGGKNRAMPIPMTDAAHDWLKRGHEMRTRNYVIEWAGGKVSDIKRALKATYARAKIEDVKAPAHVIRHTAGAWMAIGDPSRGVRPVPMLEISRRLGHTSIRVTERHYAHLHPDYMGASTAALEL